MNLEPEGRAPAAQMHVAAAEGRADVPHGNETRSSDMGETEAGGTEIGGTETDSSETGGGATAPRYKTAGDFVREARARIREVTPDDVVEAMETDSPWLIVDVREPYEYERGHVPESVLVPRGVLEAAVDPHSPHRIEPLCRDRHQALALLCATGARSALATDVLEQMGFTNVVNIAGGMVLWESEDLPIAQGAYTGSLP